MKRVHIIYDIYDSEKKTVVEVDSVLDYLKSEFKEFPKNAKVFHKAWHDDNDITEELQKNENYADSLDGDIIIVIYPAWIQFIYYAIVAITAALSIYTFLTMPKPQSGLSGGSANNELGMRQNKIRIGQRIPDIYGTVKAYPDLIAPAYRYYENNTEIEEVLAVLGNGYYDVSKFHDGDTEISQIPSMSVSAYDPDLDITTNFPTYRYGDILNYPPLIAKQSVSIVDRELPQPNTEKSASSAITFSYPNIINISGTSFTAGSKIILDGAVFGIDDAILAGTANIDYEARVITIASNTNIIDPQNYKLIEISVLSATDPENGSLNLAGNYKVSNIIKSSSYVYEIYLDTPEASNQNWLLLTDDNSSNISAVLTKNTSNIDLDGEYTISTVESNKIMLSAPDSTNPDWLKINGTIGGEWVVIYGSTDNWQGWYNAYGDYDSVIVNFSAPNGLYYIGQKGWKGAINIRVGIEYQQIDNNGNPIGLPTLQTKIMYGWSGGGMTDPIGVSMKHDFGFVGNVRYRVRKVSTILNNGNTNVHDVRCKSIFLCLKLSELKYKDVTIVRARTVNNDVSSGIGERMLNCIATRKLKTNGTGALIATKSAAQALINIALDQKNGRMNLSEIDVAQILAEEQAVIDYFGNPKAAEFSYTFDDNNLSFEEMAGMVASTMFCEAYRYGSKLRTRFEKPQDNSVLLFNHANKAPNSEKRTKSFGIDNNYDGVEVEYTSPSDDTRITYVATDDSNPINTLKIKTSGIRSNEQAKTRAWREWNKLKYRNISVEFEAWEESELLARMDRILVADNTAIETIDGEVEAVDGLKLYLSQPIPQSGDYNIYLQLPDATVDIVPCTYLDEYSVQLTRMPLVNLAIGRATYQLILSSSSAPKPFLMTELRPQSKMTNILTCINYDSRYYQNDLDFF